MNEIRDGAETRRLRLQKLVEIIKANPESEQKRVSALFMLQTGLTKRRIEEYIEELQNAESIRIENGKFILAR